MAKAIKIPYIVIDPKDIGVVLAALIGKTVCVSWVLDQSRELGARKNFEPQISVQAELEGSTKTGKFRVLVNDNTYSYFYDDTVWSIGQDNGKRAVIFIT